MDPNAPRDIDVSRARRLVRRAPRPQPETQEPKAPEPVTETAAKEPAAAQQKSPTHGTLPAIDYQAFREDPTDTIALPRQQASRPAGKAARPAPEAGALQDRPARKKAGAGRIVLWILAALVCAVVVLLGAAYWYVAGIFDPTEEGEGGQLIHTETMTPPELAESQINFLVLGLDYDADDAVERDRETMMADMILYCQYEKDEKMLKMLQIPRDCYIGLPEQTGGTGRINGLYSYGSDKENKVQNLVDVLYDTLKMPVDYYVAVEMEALKEFVNTFGGGAGIDVYIPTELNSYDEKTGALISHLEPGVHTLRGEELEFFLRCRKDPVNTPQGDINRLENQRYFYSALFKYVRTMSVSEMIRLMPVCVKYVNTNMPIDTCIALGLEFLSGGVPDENIVIGRLPVYDTQPLYNGQYVFGIAPQETADLLNEYFRPADAPVDVSELNILDCGARAVSGGVVEPEMSHMSADGTVSGGAKSAANGPEQASSQADGQSAANAPAAQPVGPEASSASAAA